MKIFLADGALPVPYTSKISDPKSLCVVVKKCLKMLKLGPFPTNRPRNVTQFLTIFDKSFQKV